MTASAESSAHRAVHREKELEAQGKCVRHMWVQEARSGLCGRSLVDFGRNDGALLPQSDIGPGDIVQIGALPPGSSQEPTTGIVYRVNQNKITVSFDDYPDEIDEPTTLIRLGNEVQRHGTNRHPFAPLTTISPQPPFLY